MFEAHEFLWSQGSGRASESPKPSDLPEIVWEKMSQDEIDTAVIESER